MTLRKFLSILAIVWVTLLGVSSCAVLKPIGDITELEPPTMKVEENVALAPVSITALVTGWVEAPAFILMDQKDDRTPEAFRKAQWVPSIVYIVTHPQKGTVIFDFGVKSGECDYGLKPVYWVPCRNEGHPSLASYLRANSTVMDDIKYLIPSHFHGDHVGGLSEFLEMKNAPLLATSASLQELKSPMRVFAGVPPEMLQTDMDVVVIDKSFTSDPALGRVFDIFGDGSLKIFETQGHTDGHISAAAQTQTGNVLLTFDASHLRANFDRLVPSGAVTDKTAAEDSLKQLKHIEAELGDVNIVFGHDPDQWRCAGTVVALDGASHLAC